MNKPDDPEPAKKGTPQRNRFPQAIIRLGVGLLALGFIIYLLIPTFNSGPVSNLLRCANNLHEIGLAVKEYARIHNGDLPDSFGTLFETEDIFPQYFLCPDANDILAQGPTTQAVAADLNRGGHSSYIYLGRGLTSATATPNTIVVYEPLSNHHDRMNVLFGDGHVEFLTRAAANQLLAKVAAGEHPVTMPTSP